MCVSLQIILCRKDAYPEELMGLVIAIFDSLSNFTLPCFLRPSSEQSAKTDTEPIAG